MRVKGKRGISFLGGEALSPIGHPGLDPGSTLQGLCDVGKWVPDMGCANAGITFARSHLSGE